MKYYIHKSISNRLKQANETITIGQVNPELAEAMATQGYTQASFNEGAGYVATIKSINTQHKHQLGIQMVATQRMKDAYRILRHDFTTDRRIVRSAIGKNTKYASLLRLNQNVERKLADFIPQARHFYLNVKEHHEVMKWVEGRYNMTPAILEARMADLVALEEALAEQRYLIGQMQQVTKQRQDAMKQLDAWMSRFIASARIAFKDNPPGLEKLGIHVKRSRKKTPKKKEVADVAKPGKESR